MTNARPLRRQVTRLRRRLARLRRTASGSPAPGWNGKMLKRARRKAGMTQKQLAAAITERRELAGERRKVLQVQVSKWEGDEAVPGADVFGEILTALGPKSAFLLLSGIAVGLALSSRVMVSRPRPPWESNA